MFSLMPKYSNKSKLFYSCLMIFLMESINFGYSMQGIDDQDKKFGKDLIFEAQDQDRKISCVLGPQFLKSAYECNLELKRSDSECFDPAVIKNPQKAFQKLFQHGGESFTVSSDSLPDIHCTFFNRNSDTLLILGTGFPVQRERMLPFVKLFASYDLLLFDYRGVGFDHHINVSYLLPWKWQGLLSWEIRGMDFYTSGIGTLEEDDVIAVVDACKQRKSYKQVFGLGLCFSSYVFAKAATKRTDLFSKLIFDGSWPSLERVVKSIIKDPSLLCTVENPHSPMPFVTNSQTFQKCMLKLVEWLTWLNLHTLPLSYYLSNLRCPILFIQCTNDCYCNAEEFAELWNSVKMPKAVIFTGNLHGRNHVWQSESYKKITTLFLDQPFEDFIKSMYGI